MSNVVRKSPSGKPVVFVAMRDPVKNEVIGKNVFEVKTFVYRERSPLAPNSSTGKLAPISDEDAKLAEKVIFGPVLFLHYSDGSEYTYFIFEAAKAMYELLRQYSQITTIGVE